MLTRPSSGQVVWGGRVLCGGREEDLATRVWGALLLTLLLAFPAQSAQQTCLISLTSDLCQKRK